MNEVILVGEVIEITDTEILIKTTKKRVILSCGCVII